MARPRWPPSSLDRTGIETYADNGAKAMARAELWFGAGRGSEHLVVLLLGLGVGTGIVDGGRHLRGASNAAGEWGHTVIVRGGEPCRCGGRGCLEAYVGAAAIARRAAAVLDVAADRPELAIAALAAAADAGDPAALAALAETADLLGVGVANIVNAHNPDTLALGGWVGDRIGRHLLAGVRAAVGTAALPGARAAVTIVPGELTHEAVAIGAATLVLDELLAAAGSDAAARTTERSVL